MKQSTLTAEQYFEALCLTVSLGLCAAPFLALVTIVIGTIC